MVGSCLRPALWALHGGRSGSLPLLSLPGHAGSGCSPTAGNPVLWIFCSCSARVGVVILEGENIKMQQNLPSLPPSYETELRQLARLMRWMDGIGWLPGLDALLGLIPVGGDLLTAIVAFHFVAAARRLQLPKEKVSDIMIRTGLDVLVGFIPGFGDVADYFLKSYRKSWRIIKDHLAEQYALPRDLARK